MKYEKLISGRRYIAGGVPRYSRLLLSRLSRNITYSNDVEHAVRSHAVYSNKSQKKTFPASVSDLNQHCL